MTAALPPIPAADRALAEIKAGRVDGLSVEFRGGRERQDAEIRVACGATGRRDHGRDRRRYSDVLQPVDAIRAPALRRDGALEPLEDPPGGRDMTRRLALRRFPNEVVRRRQGPSDYTAYGEFEPGQIVKTIFPARVLPLSLEDSNFVGGVSLVERLKVSCLSMTLRLWGCMFSICSE